MVVSTCQLHLYQEICIPFIAAVAVFRLVLKGVWRDIRNSRNGGHCLLTVGGRLRGVKIGAEYVKYAWLSCPARPKCIVHFYAVTEIKGFSCRLWWMCEWRNLLTSTHVGYRSVIRAVVSGASLKFGVQGASATNWFSRVNGARDNGIRLSLKRLKDPPTRLKVTTTLEDPNPQPPKWLFQHIAHRFESWIVFLWPLLAKLHENALHAATASSVSWQLLPWGKLCSGAWKCGQDSPVWACSPYEVGLVSGEVNTTRMSCQ